MRRRSSINSQNLSSFFFAKIPICGRIKNEKGVYVTPAFPKLVYVLDEHNCLKGGEYDYITKLAVKCSAKQNHQRFRYSGFYICGNFFLSIFQDGEYQQTVPRTDCWLQQR